MNKERVHWTASRLACRLLVRSVVNSVQAYWRFATASMAMMQATSWRQRAAPGSEFCGAVIPRPPAENQPRRNEEHEGLFWSFFVFFVFFVSSWLIFVVSHTSL